MLKHLVLFFLGVHLAFSAGKFTNPLVTHGADPWMVYYKGYYYLLVTPWESPIRMRKSQTLEGLKTAENKEIYSLKGNAVWAPEVHQVGDRWYLYYTACVDIPGTECHRNHVAESVGDDPLGPYTFKATLIDEQDNDYAEIDPSLIRINGKLYLLGSVVKDTQDIYIRELSNPYTAVGRKSIISVPTYDWEKHEINGPHQWNVNEGPEPLYNGNRTFIVYSANWCTTPDYKLGLLEFVGSDPMNPASWQKHPFPELERNDTNEVYGPGHNGFFKSPDGTEDWIIYHANSNINGTCDDNRNPRAKKFTYGTDGLPVFGIPDSTATVFDAPSGEP